MKNKLGLMTWVATVLTVGVLAVAQVSMADDKAAKTGVDAKTAFAKIKTLVGEWKGEISDEHHGKKDSSPADGLDHVALAHTALSDHHQVLLAADELTLGQCLDLGPD